MLDNAATYEKEDKLRLEKVQSRNAFETYIYSIKNALSETDKIASKLSEEDRQKIDEMIKQELEWLETHPLPEKAETEQKKKVLETLWNSIMRKVNAQETPAEENINANEL